MYSGAERDKSAIWGTRRLVSEVKESKRRNSRLSSSFSTASSKRQDESHTGSGQALPVGRTAHPVRPSRPLPLPLVLPTSTSPPTHAHPSLSLCYSNAIRTAKAEALAERGQPITLASKPLQVVVREGKNGAEADAWVAESGFVVRRVGLEVRFLPLFGERTLLTDEFVEQSGKTRQLYKGHTGPVTSLAFYTTPEGREVVISGSWDKSFKIWDVAVRFFPFSFRPSPSFSPSDADLVEPADQRTPFDHRRPHRLCQIRSCHPLPLPPPHWQFRQRPPTVGPLRPLPSPLFILFRPSNPRPAARRLCAAPSPAIQRPPLPSRAQVAHSTDRSDRFIPALRASCTGRSGGRCGCQGSEADREVGSRECRYDGCGESLGGLAGWGGEGQGGDEV